MIKKYRTTNILLLVAYWTNSSQTPGGNQDIQLGNVGSINPSSLNIDQQENLKTDIEVLKSLAPSRQHQ